MNDSNYPAGVTSKDFDIKESYTRQLIDVLVEGVDADRGQGIETANVEATVLIDENGETEIEKVILVFFGNGGEEFPQDYSGTEFDKLIEAAAWEKYDPYYGSSVSFLKDALKPR